MADKTDRSMSIDVNVFLKDLTVADGAWGTTLAHRWPTGGIRPEQWNVLHPDRIQTLGREYVDAGAQILLTNTFGANRFVLDRDGLGDSVDEFNRAGVRILKEVVGSDALVFGSIGPTGKIVMLGEVDENGLHAAFTEQAVALAEGGVDAIVIESMTELEEITVAVRAVKQSTTLPVAASMSFDSGSDSTSTTLGVTPPDAAKALTEAGADIIGCNCGAGVESAVFVVHMLRAETDVPIWAKPGAGIPEIVEGRAVYNQRPDEFAGYVPALIGSGANIVGGCCGTDPDFIRAVRRIVEKVKKSQSS